MTRVIVETRIIKIEGNIYLFFHRVLLEDKTRHSVLPMTKPQPPTQQEGIQLYEKPTQRYILYLSPS
ncbi:unnamed protein product [Allacma fusca]|uniref:Uncharacterized protein n=1 Tax=Allacma fusca TaxID=39272 RepID=A0A8J2NTM5_9HEXA|nr:unnamed protein product [Allacma fusca]